jgi:CTP:molybdopterin cytidylyltransferase MocA
MTDSWPDSGPPQLVILAAGASSRLGTPKALVALPAGSPLERLIHAWPLGMPAPLVVTGAHHGEIAAALQSPSRPVEILHNTHWARGRTGGLQAAIRQHPNRDFVVAPVDCPRIPEPVFRALIEAWNTALSPQWGWCAPFIKSAEGRKKRFGHPILIGRGLLQKALEAGPDEPLKKLRDHAQPCFGVEVSHPGILEDLDTLEDLERLRRADRQSP